MEPIEIRLLKPAEWRRLYPWYDNQVKILNACREKQRKFPHGINIEGKRGGTLILDLDDDRILGSLELMLPSSAWKTVADVSRPEKSQRADIQVAKAAIEHHHFEDGLVVNSSQGKFSVRIMFGEPRKTARAIKLSEECFAYVEDDRLLGFYLDLSRNRRRF